MELSANAVFHTFRQENLLFQEIAEFLFGIVLTCVVAECAPSTIFAIEQLVWLFHLVPIVVNVAAVCAAPVLHHVPVRSFSTIAGGDEPLLPAAWVHLPYDVAAFLGKVAWQRALVLKSPEDDGR